MPKSKKVWEQPWSYAEGFIMATGIAFAGLMLQFVLGNINISAYGYPINLIIAGLFISMLFCFHIFARRTTLYNWLSGVQATISAIVVLLFFVVMMGFTPQFPLDTHHSELPANIFSHLGWYQMTTSCTFVLLLFYLLVILGLTILKRTSKKVSWRDIGFYLNHLGLFLALLGGMLCSTDMQRLTMTVKQGTVEWRAKDSKGNIHEMPLAIELDTFNIEEYPPKLVIIENSTGKMLPIEKPEAYMFEDTGKTVNIAGFDIEILEHIEPAAQVRDSNSLTYVFMPMDGSTSALKVRVKNTKSDKSIEGWVSNGSFLFPYEVLYIDSLYSVAMPMQDVKKYASKVKVYSKSGHNIKTTIEVNKPLSINNSTIYQYSYDETMGKHSKISIFEIVTDPWLKVVYIGVFMLLAGALFIFIVGKRAN